MMKTTSKIPAVLWILGLAASLQPTAKAADPTVIKCSDERSYYYGLRVDSPTHIHLVRFDAYGAGSIIGPSPDQRVEYDRDDSLAAQFGGPQTTVFLASENITHFRHILIVPNSMLNGTDTTGSPVWLEQYGRSFNPPFSQSRYQLQCPYAEVTRTYVWE